MSAIIIFHETGPFTISPGALLPWRVGSGAEIASRLQVCEPLLILAVTIPGCDDEDVALVEGGLVSLGLTVLGGSAFMTWKLELDGQVPLLLETPFHFGLEPEGSADFLFPDADGRVAPVNLVIVLGNEGGMCRAVRRAPATNDCSLLLAELASTQLDAVEDDLERKHEFVVESYFAHVPDVAFAYAKAQLKVVASWDAGRSREEGLLGHMQAA